MPAGKKSILTNAVCLKEDVVEIMRGGFGGIYDAERREVSLKSGLTMISNL